MKKIVVAAFVSVLLLKMTIAQPSYVLAWSNGGYSDDPSNPDYGTHDWIAEHALDWLPEEEKQYIVDNLAAYLYGTELPDNGIAPDGIGDTTKHHIYYWSNESLQDDASAVRAYEEYSDALNFLRLGELANASKNAGIMSHYIVDVGVFGHVMGADTDWGVEEHHSDYETYVNQRTSGYDAEFNIYLSFDGELDLISAYNATKELAYDTTFDVNGDLTCLWMDQNYNWSNPVFKNRCGESLNLAVNYLTDVLHMLYVESEQNNLTTHVVVNEVELNPLGNDNYLSIEEWVELYNPTTDDVDISSWKISTTHGTTVTVTIPQGTAIQAKGYYVYGQGSQWLDNDDESIVLKDSEDAEVDRTPIMSDNDNDYWSWQRYPNGQDSWHFRSSTKWSSNGGEAPPEQPPIISIFSPENRTYSTTSISLEFTVSETTSWIGYSFDSQTNVTVSGNTTLLGLSEGAHTITVYANDTAGNMGYSVVYFSVDTVFPNIEILSPENKTYATNSIPLSFIIDETTSWIGYSLNRQTNDTIAGNTTLANLPDRLHYVAVYANDTVGNMGSSNVIYFTIDTTPPNITNVSQIPLENNVLPEDEVKVNATVTDDLSEVKQITLNYTSGNGMWNSTNMTNLEGNVWNATIHEFSYCTNITYIIIAEDIVGNIITTEEMGDEYQYHVISEFLAWASMLLIFIVLTVVVVIYKRRLFCCS